MSVTPIKPTTTVEELIAEAEAETRAAVAKEAKARLIGKMAAIAQARKVLNNLEGELGVLKADITQELG